MKPQDIKTGIYYFDGKSGIREVIDTNAVAGVVTYKVIAAKQEQKYNHTTGVMEQIIGQEVTCLIASFAQWAKSAHDLPESLTIRARLMAVKAKLSPGELHFMQALVKVAPDVTAASAVTYGHTEGRAITGLVKKGFMRKDRDEVLLTKIGAIWVEQNRATA